MDECDSFNSLYIINRSDGNMKKVKKVKKTKYRFSKTLLKMGIVLVEILAAGALVYVTERPELMFLVPLLEGLRNWLKNRNK